MRSWHSCLLYFYIAQMMRLVWTKVNMNDDLETFMIWIQDFEKGGPRSRQFGMEQVNTLN